MKKHKELLRYIFLILIVFVTCYCVFSQPRLSFPLAFAYLSYLVVKPALDYLTKLRLKKSMGLLIIFLVIIGSVTIPVLKVMPIIKEEGDHLEEYIPQLETFVRVKYALIQTYAKDTLKIKLDNKFVDKSLVSLQEELKKILVNLPNILGTVLEWLFLVPLFLLFILTDGENFKKKFLKLVPNSIFERTYYLVYQFNKQLGDYVFAKFMEAAIVGTIVIIGLFFIDARFIFLLGIVAALTNIIPYLGPIIGVIPALAVVYMDFGIGSNFWATVILYLVANLIDIVFVFPLLVSKIVAIHPIVVVVSVVLGSQYFGVVGMIICVPVAAIIKLVISEVYRELYPSNNWQEP